MEVTKAPQYTSKIFDKRLLKVFLAGTIEMGNSVDWQEEFTKSLADQENLLILNPRRDDWDSSWKQSINDPPI